MIYKANVLVVDDDMSVCKSVANVLKSEGYTVDMVLSGEEAVEKMKKSKYALVIVDLMLPGMSGIELLQEIKKMNPNTTVIMITGYPSIKTAVESIKLSAYDYIPKPFTPDELRSLVARALERRQTYEEMAAKLGIEEEKLVDISMPDDIYCIPDHSWVKVEEDGNVRIGIHHMLIRTLKDITSIQFPGISETRFQGEACVRIMGTRQQILQVWTPVTGKVVDVNEELSDDFSKLMNDPYDKGWLVLIEPAQLEDDLKNLVNLSQEKPGDLKSLQNKNFR